MANMKAGRQKANESVENKFDFQIFKDFFPIAMKVLGINKLPKINLVMQVEDAHQPTFGRFDNSALNIDLGMANRHPIDILRTLAHELVHFKQYLDDELGPDAGETGSPWENEAHATAGVLMRYFDRDHPEFFKAKVIDSKITDEDYDPNGPPPGPETRPTMPKGTVRVDVSDMYDWYKLGKDISNLKGADKSQFGKGPPSTIVSFGSEEAEHKYIDALQKLGLATTDIDPVDPNPVYPVYPVDPVSDTSPGLPCGPV
jgi:hypothetical protein